MLILVQVPVTDACACPDTPVSASAAPRIDAAAVGVMRSSRDTGGLSVGLQQPQALQQHSGTTDDIPSGPDGLSKASPCGLQPLAGAAGAAAATGMAASAVAIDGHTKCDCGIRMSFGLPVDGAESVVDVEETGKIEAEVARALGHTAGVGEAGGGPGVATEETGRMQLIGGMHETSHGIASGLLPGEEAPASEAYDETAAARLAECGSPDAAETAPVAASAALRAAEDASKLQELSFCSSVVTGGRAEVEHTCTASAIEVAKWGSSIPRMPVALRESFLAEVKSLQKKPIMKITTSVEGAYGESSVSSLFKLFSLLNRHFGLNEHSTFLDIGRAELLLQSRCLGSSKYTWDVVCGSGVPSLAAAAFGSLVDLLLLQQLYLGGQLNWKRTEEFITDALGELCQPFGISAVGTVAGAAEQGSIQRECREGRGTAFDASAASGNDDHPDASASLAPAVAAAVGAGRAERCLLETAFGFNASFCVFDCSRLCSLEGISHVFSFDLAMPPWVMAHTVRLFNESQTSFVFVSFHGDLISSFGLQAVLVTRLSMRMGTSAESHVGFIYQKIPKSEAQGQHQQELQSIKQQHVNPTVDSANAAGEGSGGGSKQIQRKKLQWQLALLQRQLQELQQRQQRRRRYPNKLQRERQDLLRALKVTKQETLQMLQLMVQHQQQGLLLQQQLQLVALLQQQPGECRASQATLFEKAARLLEQQHVQEQHELVQKLSLQYWAENKRQQALLKEAAAAVAVGQLSAAPVGRRPALCRKVKQVKQELLEKQKLLQDLELVHRREKQEQRRLEQDQRQSELTHQKSGVESRRLDDSTWLLETAQQHASDVQQKQRQQLLLLKGIASSRTDRILHSIAAAGRLQQMAQIFVAAVSMLLHPPSQQKEVVTQQQQQQKLPCCCSGCCYPQYRGSREQPAAAAARVELMSAAHPQQQLLLLRRVLSAFQVDQLLERGSLMQEQQQQATTAARAEALMVHFRDVSVQGSDSETHIIATGAAAGKENAALNMPYQCPCKQQGRCVLLSSTPCTTSNSNSNCTVCIGGAAAALADLLHSISYSKTQGVELHFCCHGQRQLQRKRLSRPIRRHGPSTDSNAAASTAEVAKKLSGRRLPENQENSTKSGGQAGFDSSSSVVVILPCLSPLCATCCYGDSLLLQLLRCSSPLAVQQQLLQQEVFMQQRMPLITVIDKREQQQLEQQRMQDWKAAKKAHIEPRATPLAGSQTVFRRGMVECPLADAFDALQLLQQELLERSQLMQMQQRPDPGVALETSYLEAAFHRHFEALLGIQRHKVSLRGSRFPRQQARAPGAAAATVGDSDDDNGATRNKRSNFEITVSPTPCKQGLAAVPPQGEAKTPQRSTLRPGLAESFSVAADAAPPAAKDYETAAVGASFSGACCSELRVPVTTSEDAEFSKTPAELRLQPHEAQLLRACAVATVKPTMYSCKRALQLLLQQLRLLQHHQTESGCPDYASVGLPARSECAWVSKTASSRQLKPSSARWSVHSDSDCCSTHSSRSTRTSNGCKGTAGRRLALITVAWKQLQQVRRSLVEIQAAFRQQLLLKLLQREFPDHRITASTAMTVAADSMEKATGLVTYCSCSCAPQLHLEQQEILFQGGKGSCIWWRQYYLLLGELAVLKEKALYKAVDICLEQQKPVSQELRGPQQQVQQQLLQRPRGEQAKEMCVSVEKAVKKAGGEWPNIMKGGGMGCRLSDPLLQSPLAPRKRRSQVVSLFLEGGGFAPSLIVTILAKARIPQSPRALVARDHHGGQDDSNLLWARTCRC
ncbi:hypothetical protein, conserved [Eimeria praecox]|uniref:Uncharacterized protein n=1 Tax=Eimeria praecox TaxID=51316 RepID=U6G6M6_9EIME|nr:hypothetical protein, conserved [Eimeria praecox]